MLDTVKLAIPITAAQHRRIGEFASQQPQWVYYEPVSGEILFSRKHGLVEADGESFHRELRWDIPDYFEEGNTHLVIEFSLPKYWYGHNIRLLYDAIAALKHLKERLETRFNLKRSKLPAVETWKVRRVDVCYAWNLHGDQTLAQRLLDSLKRHHFPRRKPVIRPESIFLGGATYSVKFYLKLPEFKAHDRKALLKQNAALEWVNHLEHIAEGVLRYEVLFRHRYLKREGVHTVGDLLGEYVQFAHDPPIQSEGEWGYFMLGVALHRGFGSIPSGHISEEDLHQLIRLAAAWIAASKEVKTPPFTFTIDGKKYDYPGGTFRVTETTKAMMIADKILKKFVGGNLEMRKADEVITILSDHYKPVKAARLTSFWLFVQKFGTERAKETHGKRSYYYNRAELKKAGVSLVEPPRGNVINLEDFRFVIPSHYVTNAYDDLRNSENVLNIRKA